jgi:hypothetical protein
MDPKILAQFEQCLDGKGLPYQADAVSYNEITKDLTNEQFANGPYMDCLKSSALAVYPNLMFVGVGR